METESSWLRLACAHMSGTRKTSPASCSHEARLCARYFQPYRNCVGGTGNAPLVGV